MLYLHCQKAVYALWLYQFRNKGRGHPCMKNNFYSWKSSKYQNWNLYGRKPQRKMTPIEDIIACSKQNNLCNNFRLFKLQQQVQLHFSASACLFNHYQSWENLFKKVSPSCSSAACLCFPAC